jgi:hypothetical protein
MAASRDRPAKPNRAPNGIFIPPGEIGAHAMHPPGERSIDINKWQNREVNRLRYGVFHPSTTTPSSTTIELQRIVSKQ